MKLSYKVIIVAIFLAPDLTTSQENNQEEKKHLLLSNNQISLTKAQIFTVS